MGNSVKKSIWCSKSKLIKAKVLVLKKTISNVNELDYTKYMEYSFHLSSIESVDISKDLKYLASLGGPDDEK